MRKIFILLFLTNFRLSAQVITLSGEYSNTNIFIQNPEVDGGVFCTDSVFFNGHKMDLVLSIPVYEIRLTDLALKKGDLITIKIYHQDECAPRVLTNVGCIFYSEKLDIEKEYLENKSNQLKKQDLDKHEKHRLMIHRISKNKRINNPKRIKTNL